MKGFGYIDAVVAKAVVYRASDESRQVTNGRAIDSGSTQELGGSPCAM
jgi:hypothetical protein